MKKFTIILVLVLCSFSLFAQGFSFSATEDGFSMSVTVTITQQPQLPLKTPVR